MNTIPSDSAPVKLCSRCGALKPLDQFGVRRSGKPGSWCKACYREVNNLRWQNPEYRKAGFAQQRERRAQDPAWPEHRSTYARHWRNGNREKLREYKARRRARKHGASSVKRIDHKAIIARDKSTCQYCGRVLSAGQVTLDHIIPLSKGGSHSPDNLCVACVSCNSRKFNRLPEQLSFA